MEVSGDKVEPSGLEPASCKKVAVVEPLHKQESTKPDTDVKVGTSDAEPACGEKSVVELSPKKESVKSDTEEQKNKSECETGNETPVKAESDIENGSITQDPTPLEEKIIRQIEYYFGDHNLVRDKFLQSKVKEDNGWVELDVLITFNRLKVLSEKVEVIKTALKKSSNNLVEVDNEKNKIRRNPEKPLPPKNENWKEEELGRTVYAKGFPVDSTIDQLTEFFKGEGNVLNIFMRKKWNSKNFKGSVFATFATKEEAEAFLKKGEQRYKNTLLLKDTKSDYLKRKEEEFLKRREERDKRKQERQEGKPDEEVAFNPEVDVEKGCILKLTGFTEGTTREDIKEKLNPHAKIAYVDFKIGEEIAYVRFEEAGKAKDVLEKSKTGEDEDKKLVIKKADITAVVLEGEEEVAYWKKLVQARSHFNKDRRNSHKRGRGGSRGRGGGRGGYGGRGGWNDRRGGRGGFDRQNRKRHTDADSEGPSLKKEKNGQSEARQEKTDS